MSDGSITRNQFTNSVQNSSVDVDDLAKDARLDGVDVRSADLDGDGRISGQNEARALFREIDKLERGGDRDSVRTLRPDGTATRAASAMAAVGDASGVAALKRPLEQARSRLRSNDRVVLLNLGRDVARGTRKGDNVAVWSIDGGYDDGNPPVPIAALRAMVTRGEPTFQSYFDGSIVVSSTQHGALRDYYNHVQALVQRPDLGPGQERHRMESRRDQTIRLIYYSKTVAKSFADHHASRIEAGFRAMGMPVPDFAQLSRADALRAIERFEQAVADASAAPEAARELLPLLTKGLRDLDKTVIPHNWI